MATALLRVIKQVAPRPLVDTLYTFKYRNRKLPSALIYQDILRGRRGIEIGGPSVVFKGILPLYPVVASLDNVNFSSQTMWEGKISQEGRFYYHGNHFGRQYINDAVQLGQIASDGYDFLLSSNCLEHIANPLKAMREWVRVIAPGGHLLLVLPRKESNFDHNRPITTFSHLMEDDRDDVDEHDITHLEEILSLHDLARDPYAGSFDQFKARSLDNFSNRGLHHHVFDLPLMEQMFEYFNIQLIHSDVGETDYFAIGRVIK